MQGEGWYAVLTRPRGEGLAEASIRAVGHEVFLPRARKERPTRGVRRLTILPLFSRYLFARFCVADELDSVRYARGVIRVVGNRTTPLEVAEALITEIRENLSPEGYFEIRERPVETGDRVTIEGGLFDGLLGKIERELNDGKRVALLLENLQHGPVIVEKRFLRATAGT